jgi:hypothetical protein
MYPLIHRFVLQRPVIDLHDLPMFYEMIYSSSETNRRERIWIVRLLGHGIANPQDFKLYKRRHAIDILMSFYDNPVSDAQLKKIIFETIRKAVGNPTVALDLIHNFGLTSFLAFCSMDIEPSSEELSDILTNIMEDALDCIPSQATSILSSLTMIACAFLHRVTDMILAADTKELTPGMRKTFCKLLKLLTKVEGVDLIRVVEAWERLSESPDLLVSFLSSARNLHLEDPHILSLAAKMMAQDVSKRSVLYWLISIRLNSPKTTYATLSKTQVHEWNQFMAHLNFALQLPKVVRSGSLSSSCTLMTLLHRDLDLVCPLTEEQFARILSPRAILSSEDDSLPPSNEMDEHIFCLLKASLFGDVSS